MKKPVLTLAIASALAFTNASAELGGPAPNLSNHEKAAFTLVEQSLSIVASIVDRFGCSGASHSFSATTNVATPPLNLGGNATVDDRPISVAMIKSDFRGQHFATDTSGGGEIGDVDVRKLEGFFAFSNAGEIMYGYGDFTLNGEPHDEHIIKDWYKGEVFGGKDGVRDKGLEVTTKLDDPRGKWRQTSQYLRPNGQIGVLSITKTRIAPDGAALCQIKMRQCIVDDFGNNLQIAGCRIEVERL
ncbi:MAG: hypothetical protein AAF493_23860 [Pseudomonadota bacterium]